MAGHNKWTQIKRQKAVTDSKKSKVFSKCSKIIALAARKGADPATNFELRTAIEKAKAENMPLDNIERAIAKGSGAGAGGQLESARYEAYGPGGAAIIIDVITDSKNRAVAEIKHILAEHNAKFAEQGSVLWAFDITAQKINPKITVELSIADKDSLDKLIEVLSEVDDTQEVYTNAL
ncbi:MAG: transcriptional regulator [Candidatus Magasanikbacteria bacterium GW2011_GWA2_41_55]|uniref:Transcriptional regulator n=1 Tax=Candidatus Magasanikbacteria bacterium GW2011_GWA2_41_55 TaxID=1619038 RepID=A0A0G0WHI1_9BACT|nr:MAG: transcriptional regulator [Candidatus Magasanikbacteria bacterium GW2011_GWA2_41_55]